jgi:hypothetical protein
MTDDWGSIRREPAEVLTAEGVRLEGSLHLLSRDSYAPGPETPLEMLNRADLFFALIQSQGGVLFLPKHQTMVVSCPHEELGDDPDRLSAAKVLSLEIVLMGGSQLTGRIAIELPPMRSRALDFLNGPGSFFALWNDGVMHHVNKAQVRSIRPHD